MNFDIEYHGEHSCEIHTSGADRYLGTLRYRSFEIGFISAPDANSIRTQFQAICKMTDAGAMVRQGIILTGYHNGDFCGDVLLLDGEVLGTWSSDEFEWCYFTATDSAETTLTAPSPWMLHDALAEWKDRSASSDFPPISGS